MGALVELGEFLDALNEGGRGVPDGVGVFVFVGVPVAVLEEVGVDEGVAVLEGA